LRVCEPRGRPYDRLYVDGKEGAAAAVAAIFIIW
jgi:hypothetical protein